MMEVLELVFCVYVRASLCFMSVCVCLRVGGSMVPADGTQRRRETGMYKRLVNQLKSIW